MKFMVIERFRDGTAAAVYERARDRGRGLPEGVRYVDSWVSASLDVCFQVVECEDAVLLQDWVRHWSDLVDFEVIPVAGSKETAALFQKNG
jgi:hypothetical protein